MARGKACHQQLTVISQITNLPTGEKSVCINVGVAHVSRSWVGIVGSASVELACHFCVLTILFDDPDAVVTYMPGMRAQTDADDNDKTFRGRPGQWKTKDRGFMTIADMNDGHLVNAIWLLKRVTSADAGIREPDVSYTHDESVQYIDFAHKADLAKLDELMAECARRAPEVAEAPER